MRYIYSFLLLYCLSIQFAVAQTSNQQQDEGVRLARKIAGKMKDSLSLTATQTNQVYETNLSLLDRKKQAMTSGMSRDSIGKALQRIENSRDSLYRLILPVEKFEIYRTKKRRLLNNN